VSSAASAEERVRDHTRACVRAGLLSAEELQAEVAGAIAAELPDRREQADELAAAWLDEARDQLRVDQQGWPDSTDYERLQSAFEERQLIDVDVLQGADERAARLLVERAAGDGAAPRAVVWFTTSEVWRSVDEGLLGLTLWDGTGRPAAADSQVAQDVLGVLEKHGLEGRSEEGRLELDAHWHKRIAPA
jgi:hypothetical protein